MRKRNHAEQFLSLAKFGFYLNSIEFTNAKCKVLFAETKRRGKIHKHDGLYPENW